MDSLVIVWRLLLLLSVFVFPQLFGVLLHSRLMRFPRWLRCVAGILGGVSTFFFLSPIFFFAGIREAQLRGELNCGMPAMAATLMVLVGTSIQLCTAVIIHAWLIRKTR